MARPPRIESPGAFYHVAARGMNARMVFQILLHVAANPDHGVTMVKLREQVQGGVMPLWGMSPIKKAFS
jgi:hypothetical protein